MPIKQLPYLILLLFCFNIYPCAAQDVDPIVEGIRARYGHLDGISVEYTREVITRTMSMLGEQARGDLATGTIFLKPPYFLKLEQHKPRKETIFTDGDTLWWYIPSEKIAYRYPVEEFGKELRLLSSIFTGLSDNRADFKIELLEQSKQDEDIIRLTPDPPWQEIDHIRITVGPSFDIRQVKIYNSLGGITHFQLGGVEEKKALDPEFFRFAAPPGVELRQENGSS